MGCLKLHTEENYTGLKVVYGGLYEENKSVQRFLSVDPLASEFPHQSPYTAMDNDPINKIDPTGMAASPIYDTEGNFLGTDEEGLQGQAYVMKKEDFVQGMSKAEADKHNTYKNVNDPNYGFSSKEAALKYGNHYANLSSRPDYDGFVTISEGISWAKAHPGAMNKPTADNTLYLDASKLDFGNLKSSDMVEGAKGNINLFDFVDFKSSKSRATTYALGNTQMTLLDANAGAVKLYTDGYDWDYHDKNYKEGIKPPSSTRDRLIWAERRRAGLNDTHGFNLIMFGIGTLRK